MSNGTSKRDQDVERTRALILDAAREVFVASGYDAASIREVARRAGISHGTIYLHFRDKDDLLSQVSEDEFARLLSRLRAMSRTQDPIQRLLSALREVVNYGLTFPHQYQLMMGQQGASGAPDTPPGFGPMAELLAQFLGDLIREAHRRGFLGPPAVSVDALSLIAGVHGIVTMYNHGLMDYDTAARTLDHTIVLLVSALTGGTCEMPFTRVDGIDCERSDE